MSERLARMIHDAAYDVAALKKRRDRQTWEQLDEYDQYHYYGAADLIEAHVRTHGMDHLAWLAERVHDVRMNKQRDRRWSDLNPLEQKVAYDIVLRIAQGEQLWENDVTRQSSTPA